MHPGKAEWVLASKADRPCGKWDPQHSQRMRLSRAWRPGWKSESGWGSADRLNPLLQRQTWRKLVPKFGPEWVMFHMHKVETLALFSLIWWGKNWIIFVWRPMIAPCDLNSLKDPDEWMHFRIKGIPPGWKSIAKTQLQLYRWQGQPCHGQWVIFKFVETGLAPWY